MAISVADNFSYQGGKPLDARMKYDSVANMVAVPAADLYDGCFAYVTTEQKYYSYDSANDTDPTLGKWREYSGGGGGDVDPMPAEDMDEILTPLPGVMARSIYNSRFNRSDMYDTNEVLIGKWIDGKSLYQKVIVFENITLTGTTQSTIGDLSSLNSDYIAVKDVNAIENFYDSGTAYNEQFSNPLGYLACWIRNKKSGINFGIKQVFEAGTKTYAKIYVTIQYTKTTDGTTKVDFDTDYSIDETIVGRWIDGKPIYQRTWELATAVNIGTDWTDITSIVIPNVKRVIESEGSGPDALAYSFPIIGAHDGAFFQCCTSRSNDNAVKYITVRYTKTTD